jgi:hypothetical protein
MGNFCNSEKKIDIDKQKERLIKNNDYEKRKSVSINLSQK